MEENVAAKELRDSALMPPPIVGLTPLRTTPPPFFAFPKMQPPRNNQIPFTGSTCLGGVKARAAVGNAV